MTFDLLKSLPKWKVFSLRTVHTFFLKISKPDQVPTSQLSNRWITQGPDVRNELFQLLGGRVQIFHWKLGKFYKLIVHKGKLAGRRFLSVWMDRSWRFLWPVRRAKREACILLLALVGTENRFVMPGKSLALACETHAIDKSHTSPRLQSWKDYLLGDLINEPSDAYAVLE